MSIRRSETSFVLRYTLWKIGFVTSLKLVNKQVRVKRSYNPNEVGTIRVYCV
jgi:hypothetical protein